MKRLLVAFLLTAVTGSTYAQKGSKLLMGSFNFGTDSRTDTSQTSNSTSFNIAPSFGWQVTKNWTFGATLQYGADYNKTTSSGTPSYTTKSSNHSFGGGVFGRYTLPLTDILFLALQTDAMYINGTNRISNFGYENNFSLRFQPTIGVKIKNGYALNFIFGAAEYRYGKGTYGSSSSFSTSAGRTFGFAVTKNIFGNKAKTTIHD